MREQIVRNLLTVLQTATIAVVITTPLCYFVSSLAPRIVLVVAFALFSASTILTSYWNKTRIGIGVILVGSLLFLMWRSSFAGEPLQPYLERILAFRPYVFAGQDAQAGHLVFSDPHSYFFASYFILYVLWKICGIPDVITVYVSLLVYGVLAGLVAVMIGRAILRTDCRPEEGNTQVTIAAIVAISVVSFLYSERSLDSGALAGAFFLMAVLSVFLAFARGLASRSQVLVMLLLVVGVALGSTDGILLLVPLFIFLSLTGKNKTIIVYALVPLSYFVFAGYFYMIRLRAYSRYALDGFYEFFGNAVRGEPWGRVLPWERASILSREDALVSSVAYLSLMLLSVIVATIATYILIKRRRNAMDKGNSEAFLGPTTACLWFWLVVSSIAYIGASTKAETSFSDIRTIAIVLVSMCLPFMFLSRMLLGRVSRRKVLLVLVISLMIVACLRTPYQIYPKSSYDSVNALEDTRVSETSIFAAGRYMVAHYEAATVVGDYKVLIRIGIWLARESHYSLFNETLLSRPQMGSVLIYSKAGINYPSPWHSKELYLAAQDFADSHNRTYDNGAVVIAREWA